MTFRSGSRALVALGLGAALTAGCSSIRDHQGYLVDEQLISAIQPGVDNKDSVAGTLGRPTFTGQFDREVEGSLRRIDEAISPYTRFVRAEREHLNAAREELDAVTQGLVRLRSRVESL